MYIVPLLDVARGNGANSVTQVAGSIAPKIETFALPNQEWREGSMILTHAFDLFVVAGPTSRLVVPGRQSWVLVSSLKGVGTIRVSKDLQFELDGGSTVMLAPGAIARIEVGEGAVVEVLVAPARNDNEPLIASDDPSVVPSAVYWLVSRKEFEQALAPRDMVKVAEGNLWRPPAPPGVWQVGSEIRSDAIALGFFRTGAAESTHRHERTWEMYQVLEGSLELTVRGHSLGPWKPVEITQGQALLLPPGTGHLVNHRSRHLSTVFQSPPAISDRETVSYSPRNPSMELPFDE